MRSLFANRESRARHLDFAECSVFNAAAGRTKLGVVGLTGGTLSGDLIFNAGSGETARIEATTGQGDFAALLIAGSHQIVDDAGVLKLPAIVRLDTAEISDGGGFLQLPTSVQVGSVPLSDDGGNLSVGGVNPQNAFGLGPGMCVARQAALPLTNNLTAGGSTDVIDDYSDLTVYANDAVAIQANLYQLARKVAELQTALQTFGLVE